MKVHRWSWALPLLGASVLLASCSPPPPPPGATILSAAELGDPLPGLDAEELARFEAGKAAFARATSYEGTSCGACHALPTLGGSGPVESSELECRAEPSHGGGYTVPALWGRGLVEAVADGTLLALEDPDDVDGDGISGRVGRDPSGGVGRFGRKAQVAHLAGMTADADTLADFVRFLAIPARTMPAGEADQARVAEGERLFHAVGCATCHVPALPTGPDPAEALADKFAPLYSDLLLHDLGYSGDAPCPSEVSPREFRTEILLGVGLRSRYMHHGVAHTLREAVEMHGGEGAQSRIAFDSLPEADRQAVMAFLLSL